jgi:glyoxylase-like metal-dependent hydrolase (beta-lactamase superfamily II)
MLKIETVPVTEFMQNTRVVWDSESKEGVIVDPGGDAERILAVVKLDHCAGVGPLLKVLSCPLVAHPGESMMRANVESIASMYGLPLSEWPNCPEPTVAISGGETLAVGAHQASVLFTPGHSPGHVSFYFDKENTILSGDVLFAGSIGRTDLPGGNHRELISTIKERILPLPDETRVLSGHGEDTTVGRERKSNPFLV